MTEDGALVTLGEYFNRIEASMVKGVLESCGIECFAFDDFLRGTVGLDALGGTRLMVRARDLQKAIEILAQIENAPSALDSRDHSGD